MTHPFYFATGPYTTTTANISAVFDTPITPSGWTFNIWSVIYVWLTVMIIYILSGLCRRLWNYIILFDNNEMNEINEDVTPTTPQKKKTNFGKFKFKSKLRKLSRQQINCIFCLLSFSQEWLWLRLQKTCGVAIWILRMLVHQHGRQHWLAYIVG